VKVSGSHTGKFLKPYLDRGGAKKRQYGLDR